MTFRLLQRRRLLPALPLLVKELTELAARRRTYVMRVVYALLLFGVALFTLDRFLVARSTSPWTILGSGRAVLDTVVMFQFLGIYLFLPVLMAGAIAAEKESATLVLLMLTDLRPRQVLFQKLLGRMTPMFTFLLLALPLMAVAFALGGVTATQVGIACLLLVATCFEVGACCLMLSAYCHTTAGALILSYPLLLVVMIVPGAVVGVAGAFFPFLNSALAPGPLLGVGVPMVTNWFGVACHCLNPISLKIDLGNATITEALLATVPLWAAALLFFGLARVAYLRRALATPRNLLLLFFRRLDRFWERINWMTGNVVLMRGVAHLPVDRPVAWREVTTRSLGQPQYLFRILALMETVVLVFVGFYVSFDSNGAGSRTPDGLLLFLWPVAALLVITQAASAMSVERSRQTLGVLLATPLTGRNIVLQKLTALRRILIVVAIPFFSTIVAEVWWRGGSLRRVDATDVGYAVLAALLVVVDLGALTWLCFWIGMRARRQSRAVIVALTVALAWCFVPWGIDAVMPASFWRMLAFVFPRLNPEMLRVPYNAMFVRQGYEWLDRAFFSLLSPLGAIVLNEHPPGDGGLAPRAFVVMHLLLAAGVLLFFRVLCLRRADRYLGRA